jgi:hypothetical protein
MNKLNKGSPKKGKGLLYIFNNQITIILFKILQINLLIKFLHL